MRNTLNSSSTAPKNAKRRPETPATDASAGFRKRYPPRPRRPGKLSEWLARDILRQIVQRGLKPGSRLASEQETVSQFGVSRATVREAFRLLEDHGLISVKMGPGGGPHVDEITPAKFGRTSSFFFEALGSTLQEIAEFRLAMDPVMVALAAQNQSPEGMAAIRAFLDANEAQADTDWIRTANAFHQALVSATGNQAMDLMAAAMHITYCDRTELEGTYEDADRAPVDTDHRSIAEAILAGDAERARSEMQAHSQYVFDYAKERYPHLLGEAIRWG